MLAVMWPVSTNAPQTALAFSLPFKAPMRAAASVPTAPDSTGVRKPAYKPPSTTQTSSKTGPSLTAPLRANMAHGRRAPVGAWPPRKLGQNTANSTMARQKATASSTPGNTPARNIAPTDCSVITA